MVKNCGGCKARVALGKSVGPRDCGQGRVWSRGRQ